MQNRAGDAGGFEPCAPWLSCSQSCLAWNGPFRLAGTLSRIRSRLAARRQPAWARVPPMQKAESVEEEPPFYKK